MQPLEQLSFFQNVNQIPLFIPLKANHNYINVFLNFVISDKQCTVLPELADESTVSAIDSPGAQGTHSSTYIYIRQYVYNRK